MSLTPEPTCYPLKVDDQTVTLSVTDYGPTAHLVANADANSDYEPDVLGFFSALRPLFFAHINKPCLVQIPSASFLIWGQFPEFSISFPHPDYDNPFRAVIGCAGHRDEEGDDDEGGEQAGAR